MTLLIVEKQRGMKDSVDVDRAGGVREEREGGTGGGD